MFDQRIVEILKQNNRNHTPSSGEPLMLTGGLRVRKNPLPILNNEPDTLAVGDKIPTRLIGGKGKRVQLNELQNGIEVNRGGSMKSIGKIIKKGAKSLGKVVLKDVIQPVASKYARDQLTKFITKEALPVAEEVAPLVLMAAGRAKRVVSDKMRRRADLVRNLMREQGMSLPQASRHIKENCIEY
jgi:hypothetical protein